MDTDAGDPYSSILSFCGIQCFQLPGFAPPPPPPPPPPPQIPHSNYALFGPIPDHLLPKYLCLTPRTTPQSPLDNTATAADYTVASFEDSYPNTTNTALHTSDNVLSSSQPETLSRVPILTSSHRDAETDTIQKEAPVSSAVSSQDALPQGDEEQAVEEQHHVTAQQHQNPSPVTPMLCVVSYQDSLPSTPELIPENDFPPSLRYETADDQLCNNSSLFLSKLKSIAVSSCAPDVNVANFVAQFRNASFLLQGQSLSLSMSLLRSELNRGSVSVSHKDKDSPSAKYFTRSQSKLVDVNADNFGVLTDYPSTRRKRKNLSGKSSSKKPKGSDLLQHGNHPNQNREDDCSITSRGNQFFMKSGNFSCCQPSVLGFQSELGPKKRLLKDSSGPVLKKTKHSSSCSAQNSLTNGSGNIASTHRVVGPSDSYTSLGFREMVLQALKIIKNMNFDDSASDTTDNTCITALHDLP